MTLKNISASTYIAIAVSFILFLSGGMYFISHWMYSEVGHGIIFIAFTVMCFVFGIAFKIKNIPAILFCILVIVAIFSYSGMKFDYRQNFIEGLKNPSYFPLVSYIDTYPTFEEHYFAGLLGKPKYLEFSQDCFVPALNKQSVPRQCRSNSLITEYYKINPRVLIDNYYEKMRYTAKSLKDGALINRAVFQKCIQKGQCVMIPLIPSNAQGEIPEESVAYLDIRRQFWSLINDNTISPENCDYMELCRAMNHIGIIDIKKSE